MNYKWVENVKNLPNENVLKIINGIQRRLEDENNAETRTLLGERLGVLQVEAEKRGISIENA